MGLVTFGLRMTAYQAILLSDDQYLRLGRFLKALILRNPEPVPEAVAGQA